MIARFLPGVRAVTFFTAGHARMGYFRFICWDGLAALVSAPLFVFLGFQFGDQLEELIQRVRHGQIRVIVGLLLVVLAYLMISRLLSRYRLLAERRRISREVPLTPSPSNTESAKKARIVERPTSIVSGAD
jgi:membrane protein DedA with SNARE-associated domain